MARPGWLKIRAMLLQQRSIRAYEILGYRALGDEFIGAAGHRRLGFLHGGHRRDRGDAGPLQATQSVSRRQAEREGHHPGA